MLLGFCPARLRARSPVWCSAADIHRKQLDIVVNDVFFQTGAVFECDIAPRRSVAVLCMLYKIRCNPKHLLYGALPVPYVPVRVTRGVLVAHRYTYSPGSTAEPLFLSQCPCVSILYVSIVWDWLVSRAGPAIFHWPKVLYPFLSSTVFPFLFLLFINR